MLSVDLSNHEVAPVNLVPNDGEEDDSGADTLHSVRSSRSHSLHSNSNLTPMKSPRYVPPNLDSKPVSLFHPLDDSGKLSFATEDTAGTSSCDSDSRMPNSNETGNGLACLRRKAPAVENIPTILLKGIEGGDDQSGGDEELSIRQVNQSKTDLVRESEKPATSRIDHSHMTATCTEKPDNHSMTPEVVKKRLNEAIRREDPTRYGHLDFDQIRKMQMLPLMEKHALAKYFHECHTNKQQVNWDTVVNRLQDDDDDDESSISSGFSIEEEETVVEEIDEESTINSGSSYLGSDEPRETDFDNESFGSGFSIQGRFSLCNSSVTYESESEYEEVLEECIVTGTDTILFQEERQEEWLVRQRRGRSMRQLVKKSGES